MKANEAPEKVYVNFPFGERHPERGPIVTKQGLNAEDIEYIRTDAFIEKALDYIENNIYDHYDGDNEYGVCGGFVKKEEFIENFKNYMKGN